MFVVTGGGSGIGQALAFELAKQGKNVLIVGRHQERLEETAAKSTFITTLQTDLSETKGRQKLVTALNEIEFLEGLIHNAGRIDPICSISTITEKEWNSVLALNLTAPLVLTQELLPKLTKARILNIGSGAAYFPVKGWSAYCTSKAGLAMLTRCWLNEFPELAIASVMPGIIDTNMQTLIRQSSSMHKEKQDFFIDLKQSERLLTTETVALFLAWLLLAVKKEEFVSKEWDIYDKAHHQAWLLSTHQVPDWENE